ncbi:MAG: FAD-binding oxidoreductase [Patescibacteria group bacterium]
MNPAFLYTIKKIVQETHNVKTFTLAPPEGEVFAFLPGQFVMAHVLGMDGRSTASRAMSISSAPEERNYIEITMKIGGDFTRRMDRLEAGDTIGVAGPYGRFVLPETSDPLVFFAGGVGITPFRSMWRTLGERGKKAPITLLYSNRTRSDIVYNEELEEFRLRNSWFRLVHTLTREDNFAGWEGETGRINGAMIQKHVPELTKPLYLLCGLAQFVKDLRSMLFELGVAENRIAIEIF